MIEGKRAMRARACLLLPVLVTPSILSGSCAAHKGKHDFHEVQGLQRPLWVGLLHETDACQGHTASLSWARPAIQRMVLMAQPAQDLSSDTG